ncbi:MAG TPA: hypothetical protein VFU50_16605 [Terriglobales bacterium]|nr:hypothetical protein [Terriglobales bacterium]
MYEKISGFSTISLCGAGRDLCAAIRSRQGPSLEAALFDTPDCDLPDTSKAALKVKRRTILALTQEL